MYGIEYIPVIKDGKVTFTSDLTLEPSEEGWQRLNQSLTKEENQNHGN